MFEALQIQIAIREYLMLKVTLISERVMGMVTRQSQRSDRERLKISKFL